MKCLESSQIQLECDVCRPLDGIKESVAAPDIVWAAIGTRLVTRACKRSLDHFHLFNIDYSVISCQCGRRATQG